MSPRPHTDPCTCRGALQPGSRADPLPPPPNPGVTFLGGSRLLQKAGVGSSSLVPVMVLRFVHVSTLRLFIAGWLSRVVLGTWTRGCCGWGPGIQEENWAEKKPQVTTREAGTG